MTDHTQDVREAARRAVNKSVHLDENANCDGCNDAADAVLAVASPLIRGQVAEEIAWKIENPIGPQPVRWAPIAQRWITECTAIARSYSQNTEEKTDG